MSLHVLGVCLTLCKLFIKQTFVNLMGFALGIKGSSTKFSVFVITFFRWYGSVVEVGCLGFAAPPLPKVIMYYCL